MKTKSISYLLSIVLLYGLSSCSNNKQAKKTTMDHPVEISNVNNKASCVYLTKDNKGIPAISWVEIDSLGKKHFYFANWNEQKMQFSVPKSIPFPQNSSIHGQTMPKIAYKGNGNLFAFYKTSIPTSWSRWGFGQVYYVLSTDKGKTWTQPKPVMQNNIDSLSYGYYGVCRLSSGELGIAWLQNNSRTKEGRSVRFVKSLKNGGFTAPLIVDSVSCQCCRVAISCGNKGTIAVAYRDLLPGSIRDISVSFSTDGGQTFGSPDLFNNDDWKVDGCPHDGPSIVMRNHKSFIGRFTGGKKLGVYCAELNENGSAVFDQKLSINGRFIQVCLLPNGTRIAAFDENYQDSSNYYSKIVAARIVNDSVFLKQISRPKAYATYPVVESLSNNEIIAAWENKDKIYYKLVDVHSINTPLNQYIKDEKQVGNPNKKMHGMKGMKMD